MRDIKTSNPLILWNAPGIGEPAIKEVRGGDRVASGGTPSMFCFSKRGPCRGSTTQVNGAENRLSFEALGRNKAHPRSNRAPADGGQVQKHGTEGLGEAGYIRGILLLSPREVIVSECSGAKGDLGGWLKNNQATFTFGHSSSKSNGTGGSRPKAEPLRYAVTKKKNKTAGKKPAKEQIAHLG